MLIIGSIVISVVKNLKKDEKDRQTMKNRPHRPVVVETSDSSAKKKMTKKKQPVFQQQETEQNEGYFTYETISDRDFSKEFEEIIAENNTEITASDNRPSPLPNLSIDQEEVFKGVVWSEILKRKY